MRGELFRFRHLPAAAAAALILPSCAGPAAQQTPVPGAGATASASAGTTGTGHAAAGEPSPSAAAEPAVVDLVFPDEPHRLEQPEGGEVRGMKTPALERFRLPGGIDVFLVERRKLPIVNLYLAFEGGAATDPDGKLGLGSVCAGMLSEGTEKLDKLAFAEALADIASHVNSSASSDQHFVSMNSLTRNLDATLDLWADTLRRPGLRQAEFDRNIKRRIAGLQQMKGTPAAVAGRLSSSVVYGPDHLLGRFPTEASYQALALDDCKKWVASYVKPQGAQLYVVGDIDKAQVIEKIGGRLKGWTGKARRAPRPGRPQPRKGKVFLVDIPSAPQSVVHLMHLGPPRKSPDFFATSVMSSILGGGFSSRINMNIREKNGYAYGARGGFNYNRTGSTFLASASVRTDVTKESVLEMLNEIRGLYEGEPTDDELVREKQSRILALPAQFSTGGSILGAFRELVYYGLPLTYYDTYVAKVQAVEKPAVKRAASRYLKPGDLQLLVVGDAKVVLPKLRELTAAAKELSGAEIVMLDVDGKATSEAGVVGSADPGKVRGAARAGAGAPSGAGAGGGASARP